MNYQRAGSSTPVTRGRLRSVRPQFSARNMSANPMTEMTRIFMHGGLNDNRRVGNQIFR